MRIRFLTPFLAAVAAFPGSASAQIFDTDFGAMILNQNIGSINTYNTQMDRINSERRASERGKQQQSSRPNSPIPAATMERLKETVIDVLDPEYGRRLAAYGSTSSRNWVSTTLKSVGGQVGALTPEYHRRVRSSGQKAADNWLTSRTRQIASSYVSTGGTEAGTAPASTGVVPDYVLERTQAAAFTNLQGEYRRRASSYGKADADRWMSAAAREVGRQTGALGPEYLRRVSSQGSTQAADWYETQAREISRRYIEKSRQ